MLERRELIKKLLLSKGSVSFKELEECFPKYSSMTIRRDIKELEKLGLVKTIQNGAVATGDLFFENEDAFVQRMNTNVSQKIDIALKAHSLLSPNSSIFIDTGTTTQYFANCLDDQPYNIITSGLNIATELVKKKCINVNIFGGNINNQTMSMSDDSNFELLKRYNIEIAFLATSGFSIKNGFSCVPYSECQKKMEVLKYANKKVVLFDSSKCGKIMPFTFATAADVDIVVSDNNLDDEYKEFFAENNVQVL